MELALARGERCPWPGTGRFLDLDDTGRGSTADRSALEAKWLAPGPGSWAARWPTFYQLVGEVLAVERIPITFQVKEGKGTLRIGSLAEAEMSPYNHVGIGIHAPQVRLAHRRVLLPVYPFPVYPSGSGRIANH